MVLQIGSVFSEITGGWADKLHVATSEATSGAIGALPGISLPRWNAPHRAAAPNGVPLSVATVVSALSHAIDLSTGQPVGHSVRATILGMRIAEEIGLSDKLRDELYYALLLKDCGCSVNASKMFHTLGADELKAKRNAKTTDWTKTSWEMVQYALSHVATGKSFLERSRAIFGLVLKQKQHTKDVMKMRCERGATLARLMGLCESTATAILSLDEHWDGRGEPEGLRQTEIPLFSRIMILAQTLEVFFQIGNGGSALDVAKQRSGTWFDPDLVRAACSLARRGNLWTDVDSDNAFSSVLEMEANRRSMTEGDITLNAICVAFAQIVDAKSPFTFNHSNGVANAAVAIARKLQMPRERIVFIRQAALLHDLGKLSVSNAILEKPGKLDESEWEAMRLHPFYTWKILQAIPGFHEMSEVAASHHEKLNGKGYFRGLAADQLSIESRILAVADIFDALSAKRPYRDALPLETVYSILRKDSPHALDATCVAALEESGVGSDQTFVDLQTLSEQLGSY